MHLYLLTFSVFNIELYRNRKDDPTTAEVVFLVLNYVMCIPVLVTVGLFSLYHYWNLAANVGPMYCPSLKAQDAKHKRRLPPSRDPKLNA